MKKGAKRVAPGVYEYEGFRIELDPEAPAERRWKATADDVELHGRQKRDAMAEVDRHLDLHGEPGPKSCGKVTSRTAQNRTKDGSRGRGKAPWR
jgi:hypothetical protein